MKTTEEQQLMLFDDSEIGPSSNPEKVLTTIREVIRELISVSVEVDIALDFLFDEDLERAQKTLENLQERIEQSLIDIKL